MSKSRPSLNQGQFRSITWLKRQIVEKYLVNNLNNIFDWMSKKLGCNIKIVNV